MFRFFDVFFSVFAITFLAKTKASLSCKLTEKNGSRSKGLVVLRFFDVFFSVFAITSLAKTKASLSCKLTEKNGSRSKGLVVLRFFDVLFSKTVMTFLAKTKGCLSCTLTEKTWIKIRRPCSARPFSDSTQVLWHILLSPAAPGKTSKSLVLCTYEWKMEIKRPHHRLPDFLLHDLQDVPGKTFITVLSCALIEKMDAKSQEASCTDSAAKASPPMSGSWQHFCMQGK